MSRRLILVLPERKTKSTLVYHASLAALGRLAHGLRRRTKLLLPLEHWRGRRASDTSTDTSTSTYVLVNGLVVAQDWDALTSGTLENAIVVDEKSMTQNGLVWTGTLGSGQPALGLRVLRGLG
jgi:hypothetical protein